MRLIMLTLLVLSMSAPVAAQDDGWTEAMDRYLSCLIGDGAVGIRKGNDAHGAWFDAIAGCSAYETVVATDERSDDHTAIGVTTVALEALRLLAGET